MQIEFALNELQRVLALTFFVCFCPILAYATESDPYTFSQVEISDSSAVVNTKINHFLGLAVEEANFQITERTAAGQRTTDTDAEFLWAQSFFKLMFNDDIVEDVFSEFENCIDSNDCEGWPEIERILVYPNESVYYEANYSKVTKQFVASIVNVCGVRMGTDKLTHFLLDGFRFYNATMDQSLGFDFSDIRPASEVFENNFMGREFTGVYSRADIEANLQGAKFYSDFVAKNIARRISDGTLTNQPVDVCEYINENFDERVLLNTYTRMKRLELLNQVIENRLANPVEIERAALLARKKPKTKDASLLSAGVGPLIGALFTHATSSEVRRVHNIFLKKPTRSTRRQSQLNAIP